MFSRIDSNLENIPLVQQKIRVINDTNGNNKRQETLEENIKK